MEFESPQFPTDDEAVAAIAIAFSQLMAPITIPNPQNDSSNYSVKNWRFSERWWSAPVPSRRSRPQ